MKRFKEHYKIDWEDGKRYFFYKEKREAAWVRQAEVLNFDAALEWLCAWVRNAEMVEDAE